MMVRNQMEKRHITCTICTKLLQTSCELPTIHNIIYQPQKVLSHSKYRHIFKNIKYTDSHKYVQVMFMNTTPLVNHRNKNIFKAVAN